MNLKLGGFGVLLMAASNFANAAGTVNFLEVDNDVVLFSTSEAKATTSPTCVTTDNADLWTVSLASDSGRAIYSLILTSMAKGDGVALNIESAQDCADKSGFERASKVNLVSSINEASDSYGSLSGAVSLAPDLDFPSKLAAGSSYTYQQISEIDARQGFTEVLSLSGKHVISYLRLHGISSSESTKIKLTIDGQIIWNDAVELNSLYLLGDLDFPEPVLVKTSLLLEVQTVNDSDFDVYFKARPIE